MSQFQPQPAEWKPAQRPQSSVLAMVALVLGCLSFCIPLLGGFLAIVFAAVAVIQINNSGGRVTGKGLAICGAVLGGAGMVLHILLVAALLLPAIQSARGAARRAMTSNNLKMIGIALHNYHDVHKRLPPSGVVYEPVEDKSTLEPKLGLSWRVRILPFVEEMGLYDQFDQNVPWDHPNNARLIERMPQIFKSPHRPIEDGKTVYLGVVYPRDRSQATPPDERFRQYLMGTAFDHGPSRKIPGMHCIGMADVLDGTSNTIAVVEANADQAVIWTKPDDWEFDVANPSRGLGALNPPGFMALFLDGSTSHIAEDIGDDNLRRLFCRREGENVDTSFDGR